MATLAETLNALVRRWWLIGLLTLVGSLAGLGYALLSPATYTARAYVVVVAQTPGDTTAVSYAQAYARIAGQGEVLSAAASAGNGAASPTELRRDVHAATSPDAPVIEVSGSAGSARHAADLANLVANGLVSTANDHGSDTRMKLSVLSAAVPPTDPVSPQPVLDVAVGAATGLLLGGLALLAGAGRTAQAEPGRRTATPADQTPPPPDRHGEPADGVAVLDAQRWTGRAVVAVQPVATVPAPAQEAGREQSQGKARKDDRAGDDEKAGEEGEDSDDDPGQDAPAWRRGAGSGVVRADVARHGGAD
jgi:capsular polysaccharide biosynthesis protein